MSRTSSGWGAAGSDSASRAGRSLGLARCEPGTTRVAPLSAVKSSSSHLWHGGTRNDSGRPRRALHSYFTRRANGQQLDQRRYIRPETLVRLSPAARFILDV